ncbi:MAG: hypothetical protein JO011_12365, partial [Ktedonobacteraceae bacterium]|nr:hypothetical protein [Ktedonobacteraceae bacterium]
ESLSSALRPWQRRLWMQQVIRWTLWGINMGLLLACIVLLLARITPWSNALTWSIGLAVTSTLIALAMALWRQPSLSHTARIADRRLSLHDRLSTAWELRNQSAPLAKLQRRDALKQLQKHVPAKTLSLRPGRSTGLFLIVVSIFFALLLVLPNPMTSVLKQQAAFQTRIAKQIASIEQVRQNLTHQSDIPPAEQQKIDQILRDLENKLQQAKNDTQAQQALAQAQAQLNQQRNPQASNKAQANAAASSSLQNSKDANLKALGNAMANNDSKQVSKALQNIGNQINKMSPEQRAQLSQQLENAANQASQDQSLSSALHQTAKAVADGSQSEVNDAAKSMQAASAQNATTQAKENSINRASQSLQQVANNLASSNDGSNAQNQEQAQSQNQGQQGQTPGQNQGQQGQQGQGQQNQGQQSQAQGQGQGQNQGQGQGKGSSTGNNGTSNNQGKNEQVMIPGQTSSGSSTQSADNNTGIVQPGNSVPYSQVIQQYNQMAHDEIDNSNISPGQKDLVHDYFNHLEGQ